MAESMPQRCEWNTDPAQSEEHTTKLSRGIKVRRRPICRIAPRRWDTTPCNYELVSRIADSAQRLPLVNDDLYGGGARTSKDPTAGNYGKAAPWIIDNLTANSARPLPAVNGDAFRRRNCPAHTEGYTTAFPTQTKEILAFQICPTTSPSRDSTLRNYGRAPLIEDLFADSARPKPPVREDAFGGGFSTKYGQRDNKILVRVSNTGQRYIGESAPQEQKPTHRVNSTVSTVHPHEQKITRRKNPTVSIHQPEKKSTHRLNRTTSVHRPTQKSTDRVNPSANVHPREQKSTRQVNPTVKLKERNGGCFFMVHTMMLPCLLKK